MPTLHEIIERYQKYSDEELMEVYLKIDEYTDIGKEALKIVLKDKGGIDSLKERLEKQSDFNNEISKIRQEIFELKNQGKNASDIEENIKANHVNLNHIDKIIKDATNEFELEKSDRKIKPRTIIGSILGGIIGGTIGGIIWGVQMIFSNHIFLILVFGLAMLSYALIRLFTRQSKNNLVVLVMTVISVIYALLLGQVVYEIFGYIK